MATEKLIMDRKPTYSAPKDGTWDAFEFGEDGPLSFASRWRLTCILFALRLGSPLIWLKIIWAPGASATYRLIEVRRLRLRVESLNEHYVDVTISAKPSENDA